MCDLIKINISGQPFVVSRETLERYPGTRLASLSQEDAAYQQDGDFYYFERNPTVFLHVMDLYRSGELHLPKNVCVPLVEKELEYWGFGFEHISECCWPVYYKHVNSKGKTNQITHALNKYSPLWKGTSTSEKSSHAKLTRKNFRCILWGFLTQPASSKAAKVWSAIALLATIISISVQMLMTHSFFRDPVDVAAENSTASDETKKAHFQSSIASPVLLHLEIISTSVLILETLLKLIVCPNRRHKFFNNLYNVVDLLAVAPLVATIVLNHHHGNIMNRNAALNNFVLFTYCLSGFCRIVRLMRFAHAYPSMNILLLSLIASIKELVLYFMLVGMAVILYGFFIYAAEIDNSDGFYSIPSSYWWAIVTLTTVGYGDSFPVSSLGYLVGAFCALTGVLCTGLPIVIIGNNFNSYYNQARSILRHHTEGKNNDACSKESEEITRREDGPAVSSVDKAVQVSLLMQSCIAGNGDADKSEFFDMRPDAKSSVWVHLSNPHCDESINRL